MIYQLFTRLAETALRLPAAMGNAAWRERLALMPPPDADIWIHAASVGELTSARTVIDALRRDFRVIVTANSVTGRDMAREWGLPAFLAPLDSPGATGRFLDAVRPRVQVTIEGEFWPNRARLLASRAIPQVFFGARISERSARRWGRLKGLIGPALQKITALSAQDAASEQRLLDLGLPPEAVLGRLDLKLLGPAMMAPPADSAARDRTFLAASTHEGEDAVIIDAYLTARAHHPDLRMILAPRHPQRADGVAALLSARGVAFDRRSAGAGTEAAVLLADTLGEMDLWYAASGICLVAGSLTDRGGHTPWEPAAYRCALLHGPHVSNFADGYARLDDAGGALAIDAATLGADLTRLAGDLPAARAMGSCARQVLKQDAGDPAPLLATIQHLAKNGGRPDI